MHSLLRATLMLSVAAFISTSVHADPGNPEAGEDVFKKCRACHDVGAGAKNKVGPMLTGLIGRKVGSVPDYTYSEANKSVGAAGAVWTEEELFKYLENPLVYMPKTKMAFAGLKDEQDRRDVIAYIQSAK